MRAGEGDSTSVLFDDEVTRTYEINDILPRLVPVQIFTDSKILFDVISKGSRRPEKRMMLDITAAREGFQEKYLTYWLRPKL